MKISVIIPTRNRAASLMGTLDALEAQTSAPLFEVIVIDNGSTDDTAAMLAERQSVHPLHVLTEPEPNRARARNRGIAQATGDLAVFIDDDVIVPEHFLAAHAAAHASAPEQVVTGPILNVPDVCTRPLPTRLHGSRAFFCTCNASVALTALRAVGGFDEAFRRYGWEDTELGVRLRQRGLPRFFAWDAFVYHLKPQGWESIENARRRTIEKAQMAVHFVAKQPSLRVRLATGHYRFNHIRGSLLSPPAALGFFATIAEHRHVPSVLRTFARSRYLDGIYVAELLRSSAKTDAMRLDSSHES